jgi:hypothetical protein
MVFPWEAKKDIRPPRRFKAFWTVFSAEFRTADSPRSARTGSKYWEINDRHTKAAKIIPSDGGVAEGRGGYFQYLETLCTSAAPQKILNPEERFA